MPGVTDLAAVRGHVGTVFGHLIYNGLPNMSNSVQEDVTAC